MSVAFTDYFPFDKPHGGPANATRWSKMGRFFMPDGTAYNILGGLSATVSSGQATIQTGALAINGYYAELDNPITFAVGTNGMIVAGVDMVNEIVNVYYKDGVTDYNGLTQTTSVWEIPLYNVSGSTLIDLRSRVAQGRGLGTNAINMGTWYSVNPNATSVFNVGVCRLTHPCLVWLTGFMELQLVNASGVQAAFGQIVYDSGLGTEQRTPQIELYYWPGTNNGNPFITTATLSGMIWAAAPGKHTLGLVIQNGGGAYVTAVANMTINAVQMGSIPNV